MDQFSIVLLQHFFPSWLRVAYDICHFHYLQRICYFVSFNILWQRSSRQVPDIFVCEVFLFCLPHMYVVQPAQPHFRTRCDLLLSCWTRVWFRIGWDGKNSARRPGLNRQHVQSEPRLSKCKGKVRLRIGHEGPEGEYKYSSTLSLTSALDGMGGQSHAPAALPPGKTRYPLYRRLGVPQGRSGRVRKSRPHRDSIPGPSSP